MSIKDKLLAKTSDLTLPAAAPSPAPASPAEPALPPAAPPQAGRFPPALPAAAAGAAGGGTPSQAPRTGPGQMLQFRGQLLAVEGELGKLRDRLREHDGALPTRKLDTALIQPSRWANRHADAFGNAEFMRLKQDIELAGGNVQPILVRPLQAESAPQAGGPGARYELVFGHRRHRACAELGLPVLAVIDHGPISDLDLFAAMDRENRERADLSPYEQGVMYRRALDEKLYASNRRLAEALGVSHTWVANVLSVADLPQPVLDCFRSPLEVQHRHAKAIAAQLERDRKGVLKRADKLRQQAQRLAPGAVVEALLGKGGAPSSERVARAGQGGELSVAGRVVGRWSTGADGALDLHLAAGVVPAAEASRLAQALAAALAALPAGAPETTGH